MPNPQLNPQHILAFYKLAEKLKATTRHSWLSDSNRQESVAEHSWMMGLLALILAPQLEHKLDLQKVLEMIILHDLAEAVTTDIPVWEGLKNKATKFAAEKQAIEGMLGVLEDEKLIAHLLAIWEEYEQRQSLEALFVKAIDTLDVVTQHNAADLSTWDDNDFLWQLSPHQDAFFNFDHYLRQVKDTLDQWSIAKVAAAGQSEKLDQVELNKRKKSKPDQR